MGLGLAFYLNDEKKIWRLWHFLYTWEKSATEVGFGIFFSSIIC
jgi:hypothetical protein